MGGLQEDVLVLSPWEYHLLRPRVLPLSPSSLEFLWV